MVFPIAGATSDVSSFEMEEVGPPLVDRAATAVARDVLSAPGSPPQPSRTSRAWEVVKMGATGVGMASFNALKYIGIALLVAVAVAACFGMAAAASFGILWALFNVSPMILIFFLFIIYTSCLVSVIKTAKSEY